MINRCNNRRRCSCNCCNRNCKPQPIMPENPLLANAYIPFQYTEELFCPNDSLRYGTAFPELVSPYEKNQSQYTIKYLKQTSTCEEVDIDD